MGIYEKIFSGIGSIETDPAKGPIRSQIKGPNQFFGRRQPVSFRNLRLNLLTPYGINIPFFIPAQGHRQIGMGIKSLFYGKTKFYHIDLPIQLIEGWNVINRRVFKMNGLHKDSHLSHGQGILTSKFKLFPVLPGIQEIFNISYSFIIKKLCQGNVNAKLIGQHGTKPDTSQG